MKHVPVATFKDRLSEFIAEAQAGQEVIVTKHGKPMVKLVPVEQNRRARHRAAIKGLFQLGRDIHEKYGPTDPADVQRWIDEERRYS